MSTNFELTIFADLFLLSRLAYIFKDDQMNKKNLITSSAILLLGLTLYKSSLVVNLSFLVWLVFSCLNYFFENRPKFSEKLNEVRLVTLLTGLLISSILFAPWAQIEFSTNLTRVFEFLSQYLGFLDTAASIQWTTAPVVVFGLLLVTGEVNLLIRFLFSHFHLIPKSENQKTDTEEYNAGRVIGILERLLIFYLVLNHEYGAVGFILAAKSFTRFKELEKRPFAEYVLIGTLLSAVAAFVIAGLTDWLVNSLV